MEVRRILFQSLLLSGLHSKVLLSIFRIAQYLFQSLLLSGLHSKGGVRRNRTDGGGISILVVEWITFEVISSNNASFSIQFQSLLLSGLHSKTRNIFSGLDSV